MSLRRDPVQLEVIMTPEDRKQAAAQRREERAARIEQLPCTDLTSYSNYCGETISLLLEVGQDNLVIRTQPVGNGKWGEAKIFFFDDLRGLAEFIDGLICRYNFLVKKLNEQAQTLPAMEKLSDLPTIPS